MSLTNLAAPDEEIGLGKLLQEIILNLHLVAIKSAQLRLNGSSYQTSGSYISEIDPKCTHKTSGSLHCGDPIYGSHMQDRNWVLYFVFAHAKNSETNPEILTLRTKIHTQRASPEVQDR